MSSQQTIHVTLSISFYHSTRSFQFINTCKEHDRTFVLLPQKYCKFNFQLQLIFIVSFKFIHVNNGQIFQIIYI
jgi:hypothetical protein